VLAPYSSTFDVDPYRTRSLEAWQGKLYLEAGTSLTPMMSLFWLSYFGVPRRGDARMFFRYLRLLEGSALESFRRLLVAVTIEPQTLVSLDGDSNSADGPNERYARALLDYTVGRGPVAGPGDFSSYTEQDVLAAARSLTGWRVRHQESTDPTQQPEAFFVAAEHDTRTKQFSARLSGATLTNQGEQELLALIDLLLSGPNSAQHLAKALYRYFVDYNIDTADQTARIEELAMLVQQSNYEITPVLRCLLGSAHFFEERYRGVLIKSPWEHTVDIHTQLGFTPRVDELSANYAYYRWLISRAAQQHQELTSPPIATGWPAYSCAPFYHRNWATAGTLQARTRLVNSVLGNGVAYPDGTVVHADFTATLGASVLPTNPQDYVEQWAIQLYPVPLTEAELAAATAILLGDQSPATWSALIANLRLDPTDPTLTLSLEAANARLLAHLLHSPQIHLK